MMSLLETNLFIVLHRFPGPVYNDFDAVSNHQLSVDRGEFSQTLDCVSRSGKVDWQSTCDDSLLYDTKSYTHDLLHLSGGNDSDVSALEHSITHRDEPNSSQSLYLEKSILRRLPNAYLRLDRDRDDQHCLHRSKPPFQLTLRVCIMLTKLLPDQHSCTGSVYNHGDSIRDHQFCVYSESYSH
jgi:hypothetical protein